MKAEPTQTPPGVEPRRLVRRWDGHTVNISPGGDVTLRRASGRSAGWFGGSRKDPDAAAAEWLETFPGSTLVDKRKIISPNKQIQESLKTDADANPS